MSAIPEQFAALSGVLGIGTDLVQISRIADSVSRFGDRFARRILCDAEFAEWSAHPDPVNYLAKGFAAKEAASKALGTGIAAGVSFHDFRLWRDEAGAPAFELSGEAGRLCSESGSQKNPAKILISLSDDAGLVQAFAIRVACS